MQYKKSGDPNRAKDYNFLVREIEKLKQNQTDNIWQHPSGGGRVITPNLQIKKGSEAGKYKITTGTVNTQVPTLGGVALDNATTPEITVTADIWIYVKVVGTFAAPDTYVITIETETTATKPTEAVSATAFTSYFLIGWINFTSGTPDTFFIFNDHGGGNIGVESQGALNYWWRK